MSLTRSRSNKIFAGVCAGLAKKIHIDPNILRILTVITFFFTGFFPIVFLYILAWAILPYDY